MMLVLLLLLLLLQLLSIISTTGNTNTTPSQIHIALAGNDAVGNSNKITISYQTVTQTATSTVKYGTASGVYDYTATGSSSTYYETFNHHITTDVLIPDTKYYYIVGDDESNSWSDENSFMSPKADLKGGFSFAVFADMGVRNGQFSNDYLSTIKNNISLVWHGGDVGYADDSFLHSGCYLKFCYEDVFNEYMTSIQSWAASVPYLVLPGNHEADCHDPNCIAHKEKRTALSNFTAFNNRFKMPSKESKGVMNMHYSFNYGNVHFISIDTETGYPNAAEENKYIYPCGGFGGGEFPNQLAWLEADLQKANQERSQRPWIFVQGHHPLYQGASVNTEFQAAVEDLFYKYGVDIYFSGHVHSYERDYPTYKGVPEKTYTNPRATTYLMIGGAGNDEMKKANRNLSQLENAVDIITKGVEGLTKGSGWSESNDDGEWTVVTDKDDHVGIGKVVIVDDSILTFEYIRTSTGEVFDTFTLTRDHSIYSQ